MKNKRLKNYLKLGILLFGIAIFVIACEKDNFAEEKTLETLTEELPISIKSISISEVGETFNILKNKYQLDNHFGLQQTGNTQFRAAEEQENSGIIIYTDKVKEITRGDYTSYTMYIETQDVDSTSFYNLTIESKNGIDGMFVTKYTPINDNLGNQIQGFSNINTQRIDDVQIDLGQVDDPATGGGDNSSGFDNTQYPHDCEGTVIPTTVWVNVPCGCGHEPGSTQHDFINGCSSEPRHPYWDEVTTYECWETGNGNPPDDTDPNTGNPNTGGTS